MSWFRLTQDEKQKDFQLALSLATNHPELFEVAHEYLILLSCGPPDGRRAQSSMPCGCEHIPRSVRIRLIRPKSCDS